MDLVVTDPPYKTITGGDSNVKNSVRPKGMLSGNRKLFQHQKLEISAWIPEVFRVLKNGSHCYIFTNVLNLTDMLNGTRKVGFQLHNLLVWEKNNCTPSQYYSRNFYGFEINKEFYHRAKEEMLKFPEEQQLSIFDI